MSNKITLPNGTIIETDNAEEASAIIRGIYLNQKEKRCIRCNKIKAISEFGNNKAMSDGKQIWCLECQRTYKRKPIEERRCKICGKSLEGSSKHMKYCSLECRKEAIRRRGARWYKAHREEVNARRRIQKEQPVWME